MDQSQRIILTPFNLFEWKAEMEILLIEKGIYRFTMATMAEPKFCCRQNQMAQQEG